MWSINFTTHTGINNVECKLHDPVQGLIILSINGSKNTRDSVKARSCLSIGSEEVSGNTKSAR